VFQDLLSEYLAQSDATEPTEDLAAFALQARASGTPDEAARAICDYLHDQMNYVTGSTSVHTPARDAWEAKSGVCQDFAHLAIGALRHIGIPARYVSGYLHPNTDAAIGETVRGESHAWVEWWTGDWFGFDPTNDKEVADHHVVVARAREYRDVPPLSGVFGGSTSNLDVQVLVTLLA
jgi:transglutaminase-like putative cysteine protease